jgi:hypothetical protein
MRSWTGKLTPVGRLETTFGNAGAKGCDGNVEILKKAGNPV